MGTSHGEFVKYPRTPHLFGSKGTDDDKHLSEAESNRFIADVSLVVEEKIDGTNVGIHFSDSGSLVLQCRGHLVTEGMHPQYDLFKQWANVKRQVLEDVLESFGNRIEINIELKTHKSPLLRLLDQSLAESVAETIARLRKGSLSDADAARLDASLAKAGPPPRDPSRIVQGTRKRSKGRR